MSDMRINNGLNFDRGIENIAYARKASVTQDLPERSELPPSADGVKEQLEQLLAKPTIGRFVDEALRPAIGNRELLMPGRFSQTLAAALSSLSKAAEQASPDADGQVRALNRAVRLLKEESGLRELVNMYRSTLYQG